LTNAKQLFDIILMFGAGTGLIFILRWFWWRINAWTEISAMLASGLISILITFTSLKDVLFGKEGLFPAYATFPLVVLSSTLIWLVVTFLTAPEQKDILYHFYRRTQPGGPGWKKALNDAETDREDLRVETTAWSVPAGIVAMLLGCLFIYSALFGIGSFLYGQLMQAYVLLGTCLVSGYLLMRAWNRTKGNIL